MKLTLLITCPCCKNAVAYKNYKSKTDLFSDFFRDVNTAKEKNPEIIYGFSFCKYCEIGLTVKGVSNLTRIRKNRPGVISLFLLIIYYLPAGFQKFLRILIHTCRKAHLSTLFSTGIFKKQKHSIKYSMEAKLCPSAYMDDFAYCRKIISDAECMTNK